ncbi:hypothetical protein [Rhodovulum viride]|uniref:hypothetical protein n=1 Tax=Rhodovulum viride TaxID=1231134 RepID=UPI001FE7A102|nr:hypothetical protein [Rhodovulum viride]
MKKLELPYLDTITVKGRTYHYFGKGKTRVRLKAAPGSDAFLRAYWHLRRGQSSAASRTTWDPLIASCYQSSKYKRLSKGTAANYRRHCEAIREKNGARDVRSFRRKHAIEARDALQDTWSKANERVAVLSILMRHAVNLEWIDRNPIVDVEKLTGGENEPWPEDKLMSHGPRTNCSPSKQYAKSTASNPSSMIWRSAPARGLVTASR